MKTPRTQDELDEWLSRPTAASVAALRAVDGDILLLGAGGKMGPTLARMARRSLDEGGGHGRRVMAVSRFSSGEARESLRSHGVETVACDLLDRTAVARLPEAANVIFMAGQKFGTGDAPERTWVMNTLVPALVAERFADARIVVFSTGCVYPLLPAGGFTGLATYEMCSPLRGGGSQENLDACAGGYLNWMREHEFIQ
jgi:nucleoside-diphosphate-sugar epimerase